MSRFGFRRMVHAVGARTTGELQSADPNRTGAALHQNGPPVDRTRGVNTAMRGNGGNAVAHSHVSVAFPSVWAVRWHSFTTDAGGPLGGGPLGRGLGLRRRYSMRICHASVLDF